MKAFIGKLNKSTFEPLPSLPSSRVIAARFLCHSDSFLPRGNLRLSDDTSGGWKETACRLGDVIPFLVSNTFFPFVLILILCFRRNLNPKHIIKEAARKLEERLEIGGSCSYPPNASPSSAPEDHLLPSSPQLLFAPHASPPPSLLEPCSLQRRSKPPSFLGPSSLFSYFMSDAVVGVLAPMRLLPSFLFVSVLGSNSLF